MSNAKEKESPRMYLANDIRFGDEPDGTMYWSAGGSRGRVDELEAFRQNAEKPDEAPLAWAQLRGELHAATGAGGKIKGEMGDTLLSLVAYEIREILESADGANGSAAPGPNAGSAAPASDKILDAATKDWAFTNRATAQSLAVLVRSMQRRLSGCPWAERHPTWCEDCPKRSDAASVRDLFAGSDDPDAEKGDPSCLDSECWKLKTANYVREQKTELKHAHGHVLTANQHTAYNFAQAKSKTNCVPVLITDGHEAGTVRWAPKPKDDEKKRKEPTTEMMRKAARCEAINEIIKKLQYGNQLGGKEFKPWLGALAGLAATFGCEPAKSDFSQSDRAFYEKEVDKKGFERLAKLLWTALRESITGWEKASDMLQRYRREQSDSHLEEEYETRTLIERVLELDEATVCKAAEQILAKLNAKGKSEKE